MEQTMEKYNGQVAFGGIAMGPVYEMNKADNLVRRVRIDDTEKEIGRFNEAKAKASEELGGLYEKALAQVGESGAAIFEVHQMMLEDEDFNDAVIEIIKKQKVNAEYATAVTGDNFAGMFAAMDDEYMKARATDVKDVSDRIISVLRGKRGDNNSFDKPVIILADDLTPSETVQLDKEKVLAFVTRKGSVNSHTAILARTMNIPAVVNADVGQVAVNTFIIVDGNKGEIIVDPNQAVITDYKNKQDEEEKRFRELLELKNLETVTKSGKKIKLYANIGGTGDVPSVLSNGAEGIGLFRSEFLYLQSEDYPTEEAQFMAYKAVAETMAGKPVIIRTMDIGADKQIDYFNMDKEDNPALGYRAIRICLDQTEIFKTQLRAIFRAAAFGNMYIMIPMIASVWEVKEVKKIMKEIKEALEADGIPSGNPAFGIMIETPAAVMIADELAKEVDFFSIGTNDLTQYTLAIDRQNPHLLRYYDAHHPAVLKMIQMVIESAHRAGIWAGICGELGADVTLTEKFIEMGIDELSVSPSMVLKVRKKIRECN